MAGTILGYISPHSGAQTVSMESGLDGRNNAGDVLRQIPFPYVSMESGLDGRNNRSFHRSTVL